MKASDGTGGTKVWNTGRVTLGSVWDVEGWR
jgi:hypothetical protein